jgi:sec-independent protein translocase protein TatB
LFDIGFQELAIIFLVALLVFGPEKLPEVARTMGKWFGEIGKSIQSARAQMEQEFHESGLKSGGERETTGVEDEAKVKDERDSGEGKKEG